MNLVKFIKEARGPDGYRLAELLVVNPYPVAEFFAAIAEELRPMRCVILIDDGWPQIRVDAVEAVLVDRKIAVVIHRVRSAARGGLVHAKLYLFRWENRQTKRWIRKLYLGSPNASPQGFGMHAEALAEIDFRCVAQDARASISTYTAMLTRKASRTPGVSVEVAKGVRIWLPTVHSATEDTLSFDSWIRTGRLCHRYTPDTGFGKLSVKLRKPLPRTADEEVFAGQGFVRETRRELLQRPYAGIVDTADDSPQWRSRYFTETDYGDWTSNDCFAAQINGTLTMSQRPVYFQAQGSIERAAILAEVRDADERRHRDWIVEFISALNGVIAQMVERGLDPSEYLFVDAETLDLNSYIEGWHKKLQSDKGRARIPEFCERMQNGFAFPLVPPLGADHRDFVHGLCATLLRGCQLLRRRNALAKTIAHLLGPDRLAEISDGAEMYEALLELWENPSYRLRIQRFYVDDS